MNPQPKIYVAGHLGMVGSAIVRRLDAVGFTNLVLRTRKELEDTVFYEEFPAVKEADAETVA